MAIYRFRVSFEEYDDVYRDIEIRSVQSFDQLHVAIQQAIGFDDSKPATFYMSNDYWKKGQEITQQKSSKNSSPDSKLMKDCRLCDFIADPHQKIYYVFDQPSQWTFFIELFKILPETEASKKYPVCVKVHGDAPKQYLVVEPPKGSVDPEFMDDELFNDVVMEESEESEDGEEPLSVSAEFTEEVDEEEYDNIEETSEEEGEKE